MAVLYSSAAQIVDKVIKKQGTAKSLVINNRFPKKKKLYALVCETLKCKCVIILCSGFETNFKLNIFQLALWTMQFINLKFCLYWASLSLLFY